MAIREFFDNLFGPIPVPGDIPAKVLNNDHRMLTAQDGKQYRTLDPSSEYPDWDTQVLRAFNMWGGPYRLPSVRQALSVPDIFRAAALIYNTVGSLAMETYRDGVLLTGANRPRLVSRPDPFKTGAAFYRNTTMYGCTRGEAWWWVAKRDADDLAMSLICVPPWEVTVDNGTDRLHPTITWLGKEMDPRDMRQLVFFPDPDGGPRGVGPLQSCGAAVSIAVESQDWAANFYAEGGYPSLVIKAAGSLGDTEDGTNEADLLRDQFRDKPHNTPRVIDEGIESIEEFGVNPQGAQMLDARFQNRGDTANMFSMPGALLEYSAPGSSLTYQNVADVFRLWVKTGLQVNYLEPIEEEMTDLLPRSTAARFNLDSFERADPKARWETYEIMGRVLGTEEAAQVARQAEGFEAGDIEFQPVPFAPPAAFPTRLPVARSAEPVRCTGKRFIGGVRKTCNRLLAEQGPFIGTCTRCGTAYTAA